jgi:hypothetical protein
VITPEDVDLAAEFAEYRNSLSAYFVTPGSAPDGRARRWSVRFIFAFVTLDNFDRSLEQHARRNFAGKPSNVEYKVLVRPRAEAMLSPGVITDRDVVMMFDDTIGSHRWGVRFQGAQYRALMERWFDDLWANIPDSTSSIRTTVSTRAQSSGSARNSARLKHRGPIKLPEQMGVSAPKGKEEDETNSA